MKTHLWPAALLHALGDVGADHLPAGHHCRRARLQLQGSAAHQTPAPTALGPVFVPRPRRFRSDPGVAADSSALRPSQLCRRSEHFTRHVPHSIQITQFEGCQSSVTYSWCTNRTMGTVWGGSWEQREKDLAAAFLAGNRRRRGSAGPAVWRMSSPAKTMRTQHNTAAAAAAAAEGLTAHCKTLSHRCRKKDLTKIFGI